jgi:TolB protein
MDATAQTNDCSISADGSFVVYSANSPDPANVDILLRRRGEDHSTRLTEDPAIDRDPSLSPDGTRLLFQSSRTPGPGVYEMQVRGGLARLIVADARSARYSPDGEFVSFSAMTRSG